MPERMWRKENPSILLVEPKLVQPLLRTMRRFLRKLKTELPYDPAIPLLGIYLEKMLIQKDACISVFITALFTIANTYSVQSLSCV